MNLLNNASALRGALLMEFHCLSTKSIDNVILSCKMKIRIILLNQIN